MSRKAAKILITILLLLDASIIGIAMLQSRTAVAQGLPSDMPVVFVDPQNATFDKGDTFGISVKIFNLSNTFYITDTPWVSGEPLPPHGNRYNYSLGYLYGFDIILKWNPEVLHYESHSVKVPRNTTSPDGILYAPIIDFLDVVDIDAGTYRITQSSQFPAPSFNCTNTNATVFTMTFSVKEYGRCALSLNKTDLACDKVRLMGGLTEIQEQIPHWIKGGQFQTSILLTRFENLEAGALVGGKLYDPVITGEDATIQITMKNDGTSTDTYNMTLFSGTTRLNDWTGRSLDQNENETLSFTISKPSLGTVSIRANATILHESELSSSELLTDFTVIDTPLIVIEGPNTASGGQNVTFSAVSSTHNDPNSHISQFEWTFWAPGETLPRKSVKNVTSAWIELPEQVLEGNWTVMVRITDSNGITAKPATGTELKPDSTLLRPAAATYRAMEVFEVGKAQGQGLFTLENIALIVILIVVIAVAIIYLRRRSR